MRTIRCSKRLTIGPGAGRNILTARGFPKERPHLHDACNRALRRPIRARRRERNHRGVPARCSRRRAGHRRIRKPLRRVPRNAARNCCLLRPHGLLLHSARARSSGGKRDHFSGAHLLGHPGNCATRRIEASLCRCRPGHFQYRRDQDRSRDHRKNSRYYSDALVRPALRHD